MITGGIKFFNESKISFAKGGRGEITPSDQSINNPLSLSRFTNWESNSVVQDGTVERLVFGFQASVPVLNREVDRLLLLRHNWRRFDLKITSTPALTEIRDINDNVIPISNGVFEITGNSLDSSYFHFDKTTLQSIEIEVSATINPNQKRFLFNLIATDEIATLKGFPELSKFSFSMNEKITKTKAGLHYINKQNRTSGPFNLKFKNYTIVEDIDITSLLFERRSPFLFWPSGGYQHFRYRPDGLKLYDLFKVQTMRNFSTGLSMGSYQGLINANIVLVESV